MIYKVSIVGSTGFIGNEVLQYYLKNNIYVNLLVSSKNQTSFNHKLIRYYIKKPYEKNIHESFFDSDVLINCYGSIKENSDFYLYNVFVPKNLIQQGKKFIKKFIQISSIGVYNFHHKKLNIIDELFELKPSNLYEKSKLDSDLNILNLTNQFNIKCVILRPSNVIGLNMKNSSFKQLINTVKKGYFFYIEKDNYIANYLNVKDLANAIYKISINSKSKGIYNLSDDCLYFELIKLISKNLNIKSRKIILPKFIAYILSFILNIFGHKILTKSRINHLTNKKTINIHKIKKDINYEIKFGLDEVIAKIIKKSI